MLELRCTLKISQGSINIVWIVFCCCFVCVFCLFSPVVFFFVCLFLLLTLSNIIRSYTSGQMFLNDESWTLQVVLTIIAMEVHCLQTTGAQPLLLQGLNEVLLKAENSEQV